MHQWLLQALDPVAQRVRLTSSKHHPMAPIWALKHRLYVRPLKCDDVHHRLQLGPPPSLDGSGTPVMLLPRVAKLEDSARAALWETFGRSSAADGPAAL
ncbi:hypothetical protein D4764_20G0004240 [Takifugu flavidus]|uniref:Uncharacterized protein n=1 Tax=Takifugu flavidus TaxID=433684 RepID=A0A5C6NFS8_9TELE|nr:hypothetical protein D4764_20G0004240 [Takifugu flavidus]